MIRRRSSWLLGMLACGALMAGCGSSGSNSSGTSSTASTASTASTGASTPSTTTTSGGGGSVQAKEAACKAEISKETSLPASLKPKLESACVQVANGNTKVVKTVAREICELVIKQSSASGAVKEEALARCKGKK